MPSHARRLLLTIVLAAFGAAPAAHAITPLRPLGFSQSPVVADGERYAAYDPVPGVTRIMDTAGFGSRVVAQPDGCRTASVGAGLVLWGCDHGCRDAYEFASILELATGEARQFPLDRRDPECHPTDDVLSSRRVLSIGAQWIAYYARGYHYQETHYVNHRDGRTAGDRGPNTSTPDLDAASGRVRLCPPMQREISDTIDLAHDTYRAFAYDPPWGLTTTGGPTDRGPEIPQRLLLYRCGKKARTISRCRGGCGFATLDGGIATWVEYRQVWARDVTSGRSRHWVVGAQVRVEGVAHTRTRLFVTTLQYTGTTADPVIRRVYSASLRGL